MDCFAMLAMTGSWFFRANTIRLAREILPTISNQTVESRLAILAIVAIHVIV
jgi:hypothetical protein